MKDKRNRKKLIVGLAVIVCVMTCIMGVVREKRHERHILNVENRGAAAEIISAIDAMEPSKMTETLLGAQFVAIYPGENDEFLDDDLRRLLSLANDPEDDSNLLLGDNGLTIEAGDILDCLIKLTVKNIPDLEAEAEYSMEVRIEPRMRDGLLEVGPGISWCDWRDVSHIKFGGVSDYVDVEYGNGIAFVDTLWPREKTASELLEEERDPYMKYYEDFREMTYDVPYALISSPRCLIFDREMYGYTAHYTGDNNGTVVGVTLPSETLERFARGEQEIYFLLKLAAPPTVIRERPAEKTSFDRDVER